MIYFCYRDSDYLVVEVVPTQALASSYATETAGVTAFVGSSDIVNAVPNTNWYYHATAPILRPYPRLTANDISLQEAAWDAHRFFQEEVQSLANLHGYYPETSIQAVRDMEYRFHQGNSAVLEGRLTVATPLTFNQKLTFAQRIPSGAENLPSAESLVAAYATLAPQAIAIGITLPLTHPIVYIHPVSGAQLSPVAAILVSGPRTRTIPTGTPNKGALDALIAAALDLQEPPTSTHLAHGGWIKNLRA